MFDPITPPTESAKGTVEMTCFVKKREERARPKGRIAGKDQPQTVYRDMLPLTDGRVLVGYRGRFIDSPFGLQIRAGKELAVVAELPRAAGPFSLRSDGKLLASGPLSGGHQSLIRKVDLQTLTILDTWPLTEPFVWLPGSAERFVADTGHPRVAARIDRHPRLRPALESPKRRLLFVGPRDKVQHEIDAATIGPEYPVFTQVALSPDGETLYAATERSIGAIAIEDGSLRWRIQLGENSGSRCLSIYAMKLSPDGRHLAAGGIAFRGVKDRTLTVLDTATGRITTMGQNVGRLIGNTSIRSLVWHPSSWLAAGTSSGRLVHVDGVGHIRTYKGAGKSIEGLAFIDEGRSLLVCGAEQHFRVWPLLDDERTT